MPLRTPPLTPMETKALCYEVLSDEQKVRFERDNELDFSKQNAEQLALPALRLQQVCVSPKQSAKAESRTCPRLRDRWRKRV